MFYCINLARRSDRRAAFTETYTAAGLDLSSLQWVDAIDGSTLSESDLIGFRHNPCQSLRNKLGRLGCYLSHCKAVQQAIATDQWPAVIFEDDAVISPIIHTALETMPSADLLYLGALPVKDRRSFNLTHSGWANAPCSLYGGHAYCLPSRAAAEKLATHLRNYATQADSSLVLYQKTAAVQVHFPFAATQSDGYSDIDHVSKR